MRTSAHMAWVTRRNTAPKGEHRRRVYYEALDTPLSQRLYRFGDASKPCLGCPGSLDREHDPLLVTVGQLVEEASGVRIAVKRLQEVGRHVHFTRLFVGFDLDLHLVTCADMGQDAVFCADGEHEYPAHRGHCAAIGMPVDRDVDWWSLARPEVSHDLCRNLDTCSGLAAQFDNSTKFHPVLLSSDTFSLWSLAGRVPWPS